METGSTESEALLSGIANAVYRETLDCNYKYSHSFDSENWSLEWNLNEIGEKLICKENIESAMCIFS